MGYPGPFPFKVEQGGTGEIALAANAVLIGETADDITVTNVGTNGQVLLGANSAAPAFASLTSTGGTIVFTAGINSLNLEASGSTAASFPTDSGTATPALGALTIAGGDNITTSGSGSTVTIDVDGTTNHAVQVGNAGGSLTSLGVGSNGQVLIAANSADPAFATLTSTGGTIVFTPGANTLNLEASGSTAASFPTDSGTAVPALGALTIAGGANIATSGSGSTVTIALDGVVPIANGGTNASSMATTDGTVIFDGTRLVTTATGTSGQVLTSNGAGVAPTYQPVSASGAVTSVSGGNNITITGTATAPIVNVSGTTDHAVQVGNASGSLTSLTVGTNGQVLLGATTADPSFITPTAGTGLSITTNATTLQYALSTPVSIANGGTNATSMATTDGTVIFDGTRLVTTATGTSGQVLTSNGAGVAPTYQAPAASSISITGDSGGALTGNAFTFTGGTTGLTFSGASTTETLGGTLVVSNGGTGATSFTAHSIILGQGTSAMTALGAATNGQIPIGSTSNDPVLATITAGTGISVTNGAGSITIAATGAGFPWTEVTGTSQSMAVNNGYILNNGSLVTATLPLTAAIGDIVRVTGKGAGGWRIAQNSGQTIYFGTSTTTTGTGGRLDSTATRDTVELVCVTANNDWNVLNSIGNITVT